MGCAQSNQTGASGNALPHLPEDLLAAVLANLSAAELAQARLVCRSFAAAGKRAELPGRQGQLQLALGRAASAHCPAAARAALLEAPEARAALRHMAVLDLSGGGAPEESNTELVHALANALGGGDAPGGGQPAALRHLDLCFADPGKAQKARALLGEMSGSEFLDEAFVRALACALGNGDVLAGGQVAANSAAGVWDVLGAGGLGINLESLRVELCFIQGAEIRPIAEGPAMGALRSLSLRYCRMGSEGLALLAAGRQLSRLTSLDLEGNEFGVEGVAVLAASHTLTGLTHLGLAWCHLDDEGAARLAGSPLVRGLVSLELARNRIRQPGVRALAANGGLGAGRLRALSLAGNDIGSGDAMARLAACTALAGLTDLDLSSNGVRDHDVAALAASTVLTSLAALRLGYNYVTELGAARLAVSPALAGLRTLVLAGTEVSCLLGLRELNWRGALLTGLTCLNLNRSEAGSRGVAYVARLTGLTALHLADCGLDDAGVATLARVPFSSLRELTVDGNQFSAWWARQLAGSAVLGRLVRLDIASAGLGDRGAACFATRGVLTSLVHLGLARNGISDAGAAALAASTGLRKLASLDLDRNPVSPAGLRMLTQSPTLISLTHVVWRTGQRRVP